MNDRKEKFTPITLPLSVKFDKWTETFIINNANREYAGRAVERGLARKFAAAEIANGDNPATAALRLWLEGIMGGDMRSDNKLRACEGFWLQLASVASVFCALCCVIGIAEAFAYIDEGQTVQSVYALEFFIAAVVSFALSRFLYKKEINRQ